MYPLLVVAVWGLAQEMGYLVLLLHVHCLIQLMTETLVLKELFLHWL